MTPQHRDNTQQLSISPVQGLAGMFSLWPGQFEVMLVSFVHPLHLSCGAGLVAD